MSLSKKMISAQMIEKNVRLFSCPICSNGMEMVDHSRLACTENHSFDLSKNGYINLAPQAHVTKYDKALFEARKIVIASGFFNNLLQHLITLLSESDHATILDAGCGEGSHLSKIVSQLSGDVSGVGIDLAKEGIAAAAKEHPGQIWSVADLAKCPFQDKTFDAIINILSPANYAEFTRLLKPGGLFIKVVPEEGYLKELRAVFYETDERKEAADTVSRFEEHFESIKTERMTYQFPLTPELLAPLIRMTPLSWGASKEKVEQALQMNIPSITVDYQVVSGFKK